MWQALITGFTMGLYLAISVGPILFTVINNSLNNGTRAGFGFVAGIWFSDILFVLISNIFTVFTAHFLDAYIKEIGYGGGFLLLALGMYYTLFKKALLAPLKSELEHRISNGEMAKLFAKGFLINTLNPILFVEWLTAATVFARTYTVNYRVLIFAVCLAVNIFSDVLKVLLAGKLKPKLTFHNLNIINRITGGVLIICGGFILYQTIYLADKWKKKEEAVAMHYPILNKIFSTVPMNKPSSKKNKNSGPLQ
jgi:threonine/homoserine/homoserine lactone efflux protein